MAKTEERIDKWMWATRIFKTRTISTEACKKGRISIGDTPAKPSRTVKVGDIVKVRKPPVTYSFLVKALTENRLGAKLVPEYLENITPQSELDLLDIVKISGFIDRRKGLGRPTKRDSREMARFRESMTDDTNIGWDFDFDFDDSDDIDD
ncbi:MAG: RNA-binding S4 domain-containing protein [Muribaculum sp.]|nr:RNA-binding S4 domain-containing protein [Muribaculaceae bacterium]MCM1081794.1 RNA-binding S4 domain-containing protein [Muribaculum sp.]